MIRSATGDDAAAIRALTLPLIAQSPYPAAPRAAIDALLAGDDPDTRGLVAMNGDRLVGVVIIGSTAGSEGAGRLQLIITSIEARRHHIGAALAEAALEWLRDTGARFACVEMPDDPALEGGRRLLARCGFELEACVPDYYRDGVDLVLLRRALARE